MTENLLQSAKENIEKIIAYGLDDELEPLLIFRANDPETLVNVAAIMPKNYGDFNLTLQIAEDIIGHPIEADGGSWRNDYDDDVLRHLIYINSLVKAKEALMAALPLENDPSGKKTELAHEQIETIDHYLPMLVSLFAVQIKVDGDDSKYTDYLFRQGGDFEAALSFVNEALANQE
jgi:hypothetical protein